MHLIIFYLGERRFIYTLYILTLDLQTLAAARMLTASGPGGANHWGDSATNNSASGTHSADAQLKVSLCIICVLCRVLCFLRDSFHVLIFF